MGSYPGKGCIECLGVLISSHTSPAPYAIEFYSFVKVHTRVFRSLHIHDIMKMTSLTW